MIFFSASVKITKWCQLVGNQPLESVIRDILGSLTSFCDSFESRKLRAMKDVTNPKGWYPTKYQADQTKEKNQENIEHLNIQF